ncbi:MAG: MmcQ/YjbR family DNA-binding protein [Paracoccaceae bacterium]
MTRARVTEICTAKPGAEMSEPFGPGADTWKVCGKIFACLSAAQNGVSVKTDSVDTAEMLIAAGIWGETPAFGGYCAGVFHRRAGGRAGL